MATLAELERFPLPIDKYIALRDMRTKDSDDYYK
jgi:hypothetical protein